MIWDGLAVNYTPIQWTLEEDSYRELDKQYLQELKNNGVNKVRIHIPDYQTINSINGDKKSCLNALEVGMIASIGLSSNSYNNIAFKITTNTWPDFVAAHLEDDGTGEGMGLAEWAKRNGVHYYYSGNEEGGHIIYKSTSVSSVHGQASITRVGTLATVTLNQSGANHHFITGQEVTVEGATQTQYNGTFVITVLNDTQFTYEMASDPGASASGSFYIYDISPSQLRDMQRQLATDIKALWATIPGDDPILIFSVSSDLYPTTQPEMAGWNSDADIGGHDNIGGNFYGSGNFNTFKNDLSSFHSAYPNGIVTEWNIHQNFTSLKAGNLDYLSGKNSFYTKWGQKLKVYQDFIRSLGITDAYYFTYLNFSSSFPDYWALKLIQRSVANMQGSFIGGSLSPAIDYLADRRVRNIVL